MEKSKNLESILLGEIEGLLRKQKKQEKKLLDGEELPYHWDNEITVNMLMVVLEKFSVPRMLMGRLNRKKNNLNWMTIRQEAEKFARTYERDAHWSYALVGLCDRFMSRHTNAEPSSYKTKNSQPKEWRSLYFCDYCWRLSPERRGSKFICEFHHKNKSEYVRARRNYNAAKLIAEKIESNFNDKKSAYIVGCKLDITFPGWLPGLFPNVHQFLLENVYRFSDGETQYELNKLINVDNIYKELSYDVNENTLLKLVEFLDDKENEYDEDYISENQEIRKRAHQELVKKSSLYETFLIKAEAWMRLYKENISKKGGRREGSGRPRKHTTEVLH